jgi:pimeloyl-ACP methyl ester carboxylesterase
LVNVIAAAEKTIVRLAGLTCSVLVCVFPASGCAGKDDAVAHTSSATTASSPTTASVPATGKPVGGDFTHSGAGALKAANALPSIDPSLAAVTSLAARIIYTSRSGITDSYYPVTGAVFVPKGDPPAGGWPMVAFGHRATGIRPQCAPSYSPTLLGESATVIELVEAGYVVTVPDYQGLGLDKTYHPFLDSTTEGYNLIDSIGAVRKLVPDTSRKWIAFGIGQGGQATWAANELVENHGLSLNLLGAVSVSPIADIDGLADAAAAGTLTTDQKLALPAFLAALENTYGKDVINLDDYRHGGAQKNWDELLACDTESSDQRAQLAEQISADDLRPSSSDALDSLRGFLRKTTLPQGPTNAPMLVIYGGRDPLIPRDWTDGAVDRACGMGDVIQTEYQPDKGGADIDVSSALGWISDRLKGIAVVNQCESLIAAEEPARDGGR